MKPLLFVAFLLSGTTAHAGRCVGADPCKQCHDCSQCAWCSPRNPQGGSCGVLRDQNAEAARKRLQKQEKR
jgi:hypothetical protein